MMRSCHFALVALVCVTITACKGGGKEEPPAVKEKPAPPAPEPPQDQPYEGPLLGRAEIDAAGIREAHRLNTSGLTMLRKRLHDRAAEKFEQALEKDPEYAAAAYNLACVRSIQGRHPESAKMLEQAMRLGYPRFGPKLETDKDLEGLRASEAWQGVEKHRSLYAEQWAHALSSKGAYVLVAVEASVRNEYGGVIYGKDTSRGRLLFHHADSGRFLPLGFGQNVAGFLLEAKTIHVVRWNRQVEEMDTIPVQYVGVSVTSMGLEDFATTRVNVPGSLTGLVLYVHEGKTILMHAWFDEATAEEFWTTSEIRDGKLHEIKETGASPTPIDLSDGEWKGGPAHCKARIGEKVEAGRYLYIDAFCAAEFPAPRGEPDLPEAIPIIQVDVL